MRVDIDHLRPLAPWAASVAEVVKKITYKPGVYVQMAMLPDSYAHDPTQLAMTFVAPVVDANRFWNYRDGDTDQYLPRIQVIQREVVSAWAVTENSARRGSDRRFGSVDKGAVVRLVQHAIRRLEHHEVDEWLRYDGEYVNAPHPRDGF